MSATQNILIPFKMIVDTDVGIIYTVKKYYNNSFIDNNIFKYTTNQIVYLLLNRINNNPLSLVINGYNDSLYDDMYKKHLEYILNNSKLTKLVNMLVTAVDSSLININIMCNNEMEEKYIRNKVSQINSHVKTIIGDINSIDLDTYDTIFVDNICTLYNNHIKLNGKQIYLNKARYNLERDGNNKLQIPDRLFEFYTPYQISLVSLYNINDSYKIKEEE